MAVAAAAAPLSFTLAGLESFANSGLIDLSDGVAGDVLTVTGAYVGTGDAALSLDVDLAAPTLADRLVVGGAATGSTSIFVERLGTAC